MLVPRRNNASVGDTSQTETFCLVEGYYEFIVSVSYSDGKYGEGYYKITTAYL